MIANKNKTDHNHSNYEKVQASFSWKNITKEISGLLDGKGLNIA